MQEQLILDFADILEASRDYKLLQTRQAGPYVQLMVDICSALNACPIGRLQNIDAGELQAQTSPLLYYRLKNIDDPIPLDVGYLDQLDSHLRNPTILVLRRIRKFLRGACRRTLARLEREQALERIIDVTEFNVPLKIEQAQAEVKRYRAMSELVRGGGRKLDILTQATQVPGRARFKLLTLDRILRDQYHIRHEEMTQRLKTSGKTIDPTGFHGLVNNGLGVLDNLETGLWKHMEELSGLAFPADKGKVDFRRNWYALGESLPHGENFLQSFAEDDKVTAKLKRLTYAMVRIDWDAGKLQVARDRIMLDVNLVKIQSSQLAALTFKMEEKINSSTDPKGPVMTAIAADHAHGMLTDRECEAAHAWVRQNKIKVRDLVLETYQTLHDLKEANPTVVLPEALEETVTRVREGLADDRREEQAEVRRRLEALDIEDLEAAVMALEQRLATADHHLLKDLDACTRLIDKRIEALSIHNLALHREVRTAFAAFNAYEQEVLALYAKEERLEILRHKVENWMVDCYGKTAYDQVGEALLDRCLDLVVDRMLIRLKKLALEAVDTDTFATRFTKYLKLEGIDGMLHLHQLLRECVAVPRPEHLLDMLRDWEKDIGTEEMRKKEVCILENNEKLLMLTERIRAELRERLDAAGGTGLSRRMRFELYGLADREAETLRGLYRRLDEACRGIVDADGCEEQVKALQALEAQVLSAQQHTRPGSEAFQRLETLADKRLLGKNLHERWVQDLKTNFQALDQLLEDISACMRKVKQLQSAHGETQDLTYLDVTININDIERLREVYDFIDGVTVEDTRRFCVAYNLKTGLLNDLVARVRAKDAGVPRDIRRLFNRKVFEGWRDKRALPLPLRTVILTTYRDLFDAECRLLAHTLNLVKADAVRRKATYVAFVTVLQQIRGADHQVEKTMRMLWGRIDKHLHDYEPRNHAQNYAGNRRAFTTDAREFFPE